MNSLDELVKEMADKCGELVIAQIRREAAQMLKPTEFKFSEKETAEILEISISTLRRLRDKGKIDFSYTIQPSVTQDGKRAGGRIVYMAHHIYGYLLRNERKFGKQIVTLTDVLRFPAQFPPLRKAA